MLKEIGLGLVLMLGGDGDLSRRAGQALIDDKVHEALTDGGFDDVNYESWERGFQNSRFWMSFNDIEVVRDGTRLSAQQARVYPISVEMEFDQGTVSPLSGDYAWTFDAVSVGGDSSWFRDEIVLYGRNLALVDGALKAAEGFCLFESGCAYKVELGAGMLEEFGLTMVREREQASLHFVWREGQDCMSLKLPHIELDGEQTLADVGRRLLADEAHGDVSLERGVCQREHDADGEPRALSGLQEVTEREHSGWQHRERRLDDMLRILLVSVPEAYGFLVE